MFDFKFAKIDVENASKSDIEKEIERLTHEMNDEKNTDQGLKIVLNSAYGSVGNQYFLAYNRDVAEAVTLQGQNIIKFSVEQVENYFHNDWHNDTELHEKLNISNVKRIPEGTDIVVYVDTDSVHKYTTINCEGNINISIEKLFNDYAQVNGIIKDHRNNEIVENKDNMINILNYSVKNSLYYTKIKKLIRHKVTKERWILKTESRLVHHVMFPESKYIITTNDHSIMVYRNSEFIEMKPKDILKTDKVLIVDEIDNVKTYKLVSVDICSQHGYFEDEYVYDIEVDDETHTFIGNDILVHNSNFLTFQPIINSSRYEGDPVEFVLNIYNYRLKELFERNLNKYAENYKINNLQKFEMEKVSKSGIWLGKKNYVLDVIYKEPGIHYKSLSKFTYKGIEIVQKGTAKFAREKLKIMIEYIFQKLPNDLKVSEIIKILKTYKEEFKLENIENISITKGITDYEKSVLNDRNVLSLATGCPYHVRAAAIYNYYLNQHKQYKNKYNLIHSGDKVRLYYVKDYPESQNVFGYLPGDYPIEFAPPFDYDEMFFRTIIKPINRFLEALKIGVIPSNLVTAKKLW